MPRPELARGDRKRERGRWRGPLDQHRAVLDAVAVVDDAVVVVIVVIVVVVVVVIVVVVVVVVVGFALRDGRGLVGGITMLRSTNSTVGPGGLVGAMAVILRKGAKRARISARLIALSAKKQWSSPSGSVPKAGVPWGVCAGDVMIRERSEGVCGAGGDLFIWMTTCVRRVVVCWMGGTRMGDEERASIWDGT